MLSAVRAALLLCAAVTNNPVYHFFDTPGNVGPLVLRLATAAVFFFHGTQKALGWFGGIGWHRTIETWTAVTGLGLPSVTGPLAMVAELVICAALALGFFTRLAGIGVVLVMSGTLFAVSKSAPAFPDLEFPLMVWAAGLALLCIGGGALSMDRAVSKNLLPIVG